MWVKFQDFWECDHYVSRPSIILYTITVVTHLSSQFSIRLVLLYLHACSRPVNNFAIENC